METTLRSRGPSPWPGSRHEDLLLWEFDDVRSLPEAAARFGALADELQAAHEAGWAMQKPLRDGHLYAERPSRRQRARSEDTLVSPARVSPPKLAWRLRLVDEPAPDGRPRLDFSRAKGTPTLTAQSGGLRQLSGPVLDAALMAELNRQVTPEEIRGRRWAIARARVGPALDLVAEGSLLRSHALIDGVLLRTIETLGFRHAGDRATSLSQAAAAYRRLAAAAVAMDGAGGQLGTVDDGFLTVDYPAT